VGGDRRAYQPAAYATVSTLVRSPKARRGCAKVQAASRESVFYIVGGPHSSRATKNTTLALRRLDRPTGGSIARFPLERRRHRAHPRCTSALCLTRCHGDLVAPKVAHAKSRSSQCAARAFEFSHSSIIAAAALFSVHQADT
jgi:hypothetical protein